jgi:glyoxylase-like metal-dependent hydrolase (beta-lactamase superfamily II)
MKAVIVPVTPFQQNCTILWDEPSRTGAVVDPGGKVARLRAVVAEHGVAVEKILLTHGHIDHAGAAGDLAVALGVPIEGPQREDAFWIDQLVEQSARFGLPPARPFVPGRWLDDGDEVRVGRLRFEVRHCPGHTPGHVVYFEPETRIAFVGDVLFRGSIGRTDFPRGDYDALLASIRERLWPLGDDVTFVPGHGPASTFGEERRSNPFVGDHAAGR